MSQIFHPSFNTLSRASIFGAVFFVAGAVLLAGAIARSAYMTDAYVVREQPVPFSHKHHVGDIGLDCRYCHTSVETGSFAGIPPTKTCMNCHSQIWQDSEMLEPVRASYRNDKPLTWTRVHDLPDYVFFDHGIHVKKGVGCSTCHGRVDQMPLMWKEKSLLMEWCVDCHRDPARYVREPSKVFDMEWAPPRDQAAAGKKLVAENKIRSLTSCSTCHR
ncbi:MAG: cytochrome c3 family protein [Candidatus Wallbacteria bacterium]|nr:cytochrome c3 family protein [Candidatus Wallbacteria bacterium]